MRLAPSTSRGRLRRRLARSIEQGTFYWLGLAAGTGITGWTVAGVLGLMVLSSVIDPVEDA